MKVNKAVIRSPTGGVADAGKTEMALEAISLLEKSRELVKFSIEKRKQSLLRQATMAKSFSYLSIPDLEIIKVALIDFNNKTFSKIQDAEKNQSNPICIAELSKQYSRTEELKVAIEAEIFNLKQE